MEEGELLVAAEELRAQHLPLPQHPDPRPGGRREGDRWGDEVAAW